MCRRRVGPVVAEAQRVPTRRVGLEDPDLRDLAERDRRAGRAQDAVHGLDDDVVHVPGIGRLAGAAAQRAAAVDQVGRDAGSLAGRVSERQLVVEGDAELEHAEEHGHEHRDDDCELDQTLAALVPSAPADSEAEDAPPGHRIGSIRISFDRTMVYPPPFSERKLRNGVCHVYS